MIRTLDVWIPLQAARSTAPAASVPHADRKQPLFITVGSRRVNAPGGARTREGRLGSGRGHGYSRASMAYPLPAFVSTMLNAQPSPPRQVPVFSVVRAVLGGFDCAIYAAGAVVGIAFGL